MVILDSFTKPFLCYLVGFAVTKFLISDSMFTSDSGKKLRILKAIMVVFPVPIKGKTLVAKCLISIIFSLIALGGRWD